MQGTDGDTCVHAQCNLVGVRVGVGVGGGARAVRLHGNGLCAITGPAHSAVEPIAKRAEAGQQGVASEAFDLTAAGVHLAKHDPECGIQMLRQAFRPNRTLLGQPRGQRAVAGNVGQQHGCVELLVRRICAMLQQGSTQCCRSETIPAGSTDLGK